MEKEEKIVKAYSNNSKKARLKRNKNKFQRVWDAEKQTYVKVRKKKYFNRTNDNAVENIESKMKALKRRQESRKTKSAPVGVKKTNNLSKLRKPETKQPARKEQQHVHAKTTNAITFNMSGIKHVWNPKTLRYVRAALY